MKLSIPSGTTSKRIGIFIQDSSSTTGAGLSGLAFNTSGLKCYSWIDTDGNAAGTAQTLATATLGTWTTIGFVEKDATNMKGMYEFGIPNALIAAGVKWAIIYFYGATNMAPLVLEIEVTAVSNQDSVRGGMTALPNAAAEAAGGLYTRGTGAGQIKQTNNGEIDSNVTHINNVVTTPVTTIKAVQGLTTADTIATYTGNTPQTGDCFARIGANGIGLSAIPDEAGVTTLLSRLSALRAGYLDNLSAGAVALASGVTVTTNNDKTGYSIGSNGLDSGAITAAAKNAIADSILDRNMATGTDSGTDSTATRTPRQALRILRNKASIAAGVLTVTKEDDSTASWTAAIATTAGNPISSVDPT